MLIVRLFHCIYNTYYKECLAICHDSINQVALSMQANNNNRVNVVDTNKSRALIKDKT